MKIRLTFKTPDVVNDALSQIEMTEEEQAAAEDVLDDWVRYGEYLTVMVDTDDRSCTAIPTYA